MGIMAHTVILYCHTCKESEEQPLLGSVVLIKVKSKAFSITSLVSIRLGHHQPQATVHHVIEPQSPFTYHGQNTAKPITMYTINTAQVQYLRLTT